MRKVISVLLAAMCTLATTAWAQAPAAGKSSASLAATLEQRVRQGWETFKNKDRTAYAALCADGFTAVFADNAGEHDLNSALEAMAQITVNSYTLSGFQVTSLGANAALVRYQAAANVAMGSGPAEDAKLAVTEVWVKRGGQWKGLRYHESTLK